MTKYLTLNDGEGTPVSEDITLKFACCDCGLVHTIQHFKTEEGLEIVFWRDNRTTAQLRRYSYGNLQNMQNDGEKYKMIRVG